MSQPQWITKAGSLGTIPEGIFYQVPIRAVAEGEDVFYKIVAGELPAGIQIRSDGVLEGVPKNIARIQGVPIEVSDDITSKFAVRAYTIKESDGEFVVDRINDRTFSITVTGNDVPEFVTPPGNIGTFFDGTKVKIPILFTDDDIDNTVTIKLVSGKLPPGLSLDSRTGVISGIIDPLVPVSGFDSLYLASVDGTRDSRVDSFNFSSGSFDFNNEPFDESTPGLSSIGKNFQFTLAITDGKESNLRSFEIFVYAVANFDASSTTITTDNVFITADGSPVRLPVLINDGGEIGPIRSDNYFAYKFSGIDFDNEPFLYELVFDIGDSLPPGLNFNTTTGWLAGYIPDQGTTENIFNFGIRVRKINYPAAVSATTRFSINMIASTEGSVIWLSPEFLGEIDNGAISQLSVVARDVSGKELQYRLSPDSLGKLPVGLSLTIAGNIVGKASFSTFSFDNGLTTFDKSTLNKSTTFDQEFKFTVNAYSSTNESISIFKTFKIKVNRTFEAPFQNLYIKAMPPESDRDILNQLLQNQDIIPVKSLYRADDPNFGISKYIKYMHAYGLSIKEIQEYVAAMELNHHLKTFSFGEIKWAQARLPDGSILYEVVYSQLQDRMVNKKGESVAKEILWPVKISGTREALYPNSLTNMRDQMFNTIGRSATNLPLWMTGKQANGRVLGFTPAWVIAYVKPGEAAKIAYNIQRKFGQQLSLIDFTADRYILDRSGSYAWDIENNRWDQSYIEKQNTVTTTDVYDKYLLYPKKTILG